MYPDNNVTNFVREIREVWQTGHATEHGYRPALERLMSSFDDVKPVNDPKRSDHGNPDFVFLKESNKHIILGYAEAKDIMVDLNKVETTNQMHRYTGYDNLLLTNCLEFRFFKNGVKNQGIAIGEIKNGQLELHEHMYTQLANELRAFLEQPPENIKSGKRLAEIMGAKARRIRDNVKMYLTKEDERNEELGKIYSMIQKLLVHDLNPEKFADMYAQTLIYGLFVARYNDASPRDFNRKEARDLVPASNPFLREFFDHIVGPRFDTRLAYIVDELCEVFAVSDVKIIIQKHLRLFEVDNEKDPIIHFYEDFLKEYDPLERKKMGAYYTPIPVVRFIVKSVDEILKREFSLPKGLADSTKKSVIVTRQGIKSKVDMHKVQILDPAVGTATFLNEIIKLIHKNFEGQEGRWPSYVETDLLPRLHGFELMMAPYTIAHLKLGMTLTDTGVKDFKQRLGVYLTNTLEEGMKLQQDLFSLFGLAEVVSKEADEAAKIKHEKPIMVIIGNPPYSIISNNLSSSQRDLVNKYKFIDNVPIIEKGALRLEMNLNDDYVKFIAFAEETILKNGEGILAYINNNTWLDSNSHRGMRWHLLQTFDQVYVVNLGSSGVGDQNVFDIKQNVCINIFIKNSAAQRKNRLGRVFRIDVTGNRKTKFKWLDQQTLSSVNWQEIEPKNPQFEFVKRDRVVQKEYLSGIPLNELFSKFSTSILTARDNFAVSFDENELRKRVDDFSNSDLNNGQIATKYGLKGNVAWNLDEKRRNFLDSDPKNIIQHYDYRPFDKRYIAYDDNIIQCPRKEIMQNIEGRSNIAICTCRFLSSETWNHILLTSKLVDDSFISNRSKERGQVFVLYLYHDDGTRTPNFKPETLKQFSKNLVQSYEPEDILDYIYAVLYSPKYREKYNEFLKIDFPRVPVPRNDQELHGLAGFGKQLRELHLMTSPKLNEFITTFPESGSEEIEKISYENGKVWINGQQYFENMPEIAWNFSIGSYQPAQKWLKDRKGRKLKNEDIEHYQKIIKLLTETQKIMIKINELTSF